MVKVLALAPEQRMHREQLLELLWPDRSAASAANNLHQALHVARRELGGGDGELLALRDGLVVLRADGVVETDVRVFRQLAGHALASRELADLEAAVEAYAGELLPEDRFAEWASGPRNDLRQTYCDVLVAYAEKAENAAVAAEALRRANEADPVHEAAARAYMRLLAGEGRRSEALALYERLREDLDKTFGTDPDPDTRRLYRDLLIGSSETGGGADTRTEGAGDGNTGAGTGGADVGTGMPVGPADAGVGLGVGLGYAGARAGSNIPAGLTSFVGRERQVAEVRRELARARLVTLTGPGGVGKTRLAEEAARGLIARHADGVWLVDLAPVTAAERLSDAVAEAMGLDPAAGADPVRVLVARLVARDVLLLFDNCEHVLDACARLLRRLLAECPALRVLTTSREPLHVPGEVILRVPSLAVPDRVPSTEMSDLAEAVDDALGRESVRLFVERALDVRPEFHLDQDTVGPVVEICRRLDGVPLAIELAAARLAHLAPAEIAERLGNALTVLGGGDRMTRHATLRAALQWSHGMLTEPEQVLLRRLSVFAGGFTLAAAEGVGAAEPLAPEMILDCLGRLVDKSMVLAEPAGQRSRFRLLETIRQFGREQLANSGEEAGTRTAHFEYYLRLAVDHDPDRRRDVVEARPQLLDEEHDNLRVALGRALRTDPDRALLLAVSLWRFWLARGHFAEGSRWLEEALAAASPDCCEERARALLALALLDARLGRVDRFAELGEAAVAIAPRQDYTRVLAGFLEPVRGNAAEALAIADRGMAEEAPEVVAAAYWLRSVLELSREETTAALKFLHDTLAAVERVPSATAPFLPVVTATLVLVPCAGRWVPAFEETALVGRRVGRAQAVGYIWSAIGSAYRTDRDLPMAAGAVRHAAEVFERLGDDAGRAFALHQLGCIERDLSSYASARTHLGEALRLRRQLGDRRGENLTLANLGLTEAAAGDIDTGRRLAEAALHRSQEIEDGPGTGGGLLDLAVLELFAGDRHRSRELAGQAVEALRPQGYPRLTGWALLFLAELGQDTAGNAREAATHFAKAGCRIGLAKTAEILAKAR
ncbi:hypothetical protein HH310_25950 [Actinoplanes sp. TBRC 11911]|uniref:AfsR/SARP family transcriptional regulator n=1 Tax=Actinoplanes sp. TBRC 11911 TaxID=2729386 RepID=UPI00145F84BE|nr:BTAD domain-containing putative transcriptional regulator [Actinoplanes sp. TBRC 11911]NMO54615.1 hypothetical protein [Actinoplanes sp. TBRC 11911]